MKINNTYVINERRFIENMINTKKNEMDAPISSVINLLAKYYFNNSLKPKELSYVVNSKLSDIEKGNKYFREFEYMDLIQSSCKKMIDGKISHELYEKDSIPVYKSEYDLIETLETKREKKLMFTLIVLARFSRHKGWVSESYSNIFKLANVHCSVKEKAVLMYNLSKQELIRTSKISMNQPTSIHVNVLSKDDKEIFYKVTNINSLGNTYFMSLNPKKYALCECCNRLIVKTANNMKYCKKCANKISLQRSIDTRKKKSVEQRLEDYLN